MNFLFPKQKKGGGGAKAFVEKSNFCIFFPPLPRPIRCLDRNPCLYLCVVNYQSFPEIINHVRRLKFRGGATLRSSIASEVPLFWGGVWALLRTHAQEEKKKKKQGHPSPLISNSISANMASWLHWQVLTLRLHLWLRNIFWWLEINYSQVRIKEDTLRGGKKRGLWLYTRRRVNKLASPTNKIPCRVARGQLQK